MFLCETFRTAQAAHRVQRTAFRNVKKRHIVNSFSQFLDFLHIHRPFVDFLRDFTAKKRFRAFFYLLAHELQRR